MPTIFIKWLWSVLLAVLPFERDNLSEWVFPVLFQWQAHRFGVTRHVSIRFPSAGPGFTHSQKYTQIGFGMFLEEDFSGEEIIQIAPGLPKVDLNWGQHFLGGHNLAPPDCSRHQDWPSWTSHHWSPGFPTMLQVYISGKNVRKNHTKPLSSSCLSDRFVPKIIIKWACLDPYLIHSKQTENYKNDGC